MHAAGAMEVCCAAPTGGSAGVLPGFLHALEAEDPDEPRLLRALWAAGGIGAVFGSRATFAAEVAGCQVEIGAAGAMAAAGAVEWAGGGPEAACDAAATVLQNVMGSVCDPVQGCVEIPCHSRNAFLSAGAFLAADWILGGCPNPVPLDETIDAVLSVGRMLPSELRCTALGGLALCPSARAIRPRR
jgi:L-serine dehydratase